MIRLDTTTRKLQVVLAGAVSTNQLPVVVSYSDKTSTTYNGATQTAQTNGTTAVDICAAPASSTIRDVDYINIYNADTSEATITVRCNDNGTLYQLVKTTLKVGSQITYTHSSGWQMMLSDGSIKSGSSFWGGISGTLSDQSDLQSTVESLSPALTYGRNQYTSSGLTWGYYGGNVTLSNGTMSKIANGTLTLTASATNYVVANKATGAVSASTSTTNWNDSVNYWRLYSVVVGAATVTSYADSRELAKYTGSSDLASLGAEAKANRDASGGYVGLTLFKINFRNAANTFTSFFTNTNTAARTYTLPDKDGTVAMTSDITGTNSGTNTGDETAATIKAKLGITTLSGSNTGDQTLESLGAQSTANRDASNGYAGLTLFKINFRNAANTFTSFFTNTNTAARTYTFQNKDGTIADLADVATKQDASAALTDFVAAATGVGDAITDVPRNAELGTAAYVDIESVPQNVFPVLQSTDRTLTIDDSGKTFVVSGTTTITLPLAADVFNASVPYNIAVKAITGATVTVARSGSDTIETVSGNKSMTANTGLVFFPTSTTTWETI